MNVEPGDIVQLDPETYTHHDGFWAGNLLVVTEVKSWGVQGYCRGDKGRAFLRPKFGTFVRVGRLHWTTEES